MARDGDEPASSQSGEEEEEEEEEEEGVAAEKPPPEFFAADGDEEDEAWLDKQRGGRETDANLSCPCCLATLCIDCQKHDVYATQFRAMFVRNCLVSRTERLREGGGESGAVFYSVRCADCLTEVAVRDEEEVYHFFNVLATAG